MREQTMKFNHIQAQQKFKFEGQVYLKTTPLIAVQVETGTQRLIPRSAEVELISESSSEKPAKNLILTKESLFNAISIHQQKMDILIDNIKLDLNDETYQMLKNEIAKLYQQFCQQLEINPLTSQ